MYGITDCDVLTIMLHGIQLVKPSAAIFMKNPLSLWLLSSSLETSVLSNNRPIRILIAAQLNRNGPQPRRSVQTLLPTHTYHNSPNTLDPSDRQPLTAPKPLQFQGPRPAQCRPNAHLHRVPAPGQDAMARGRRRQVGRTQHPPDSVQKLRPLLRQIRRARLCGAVYRPGLDQTTGALSA